MAATYASSVQTAGFSGGMNTATEAALLKESGAIATTGEMWINSAGALTQQYYSPTFPIDYQEISYRFCRKVICATCGYHALSLWSVDKDINLREVALAYTEGGEQKPEKFAVTVAGSGAVWTSAFWGNAHYFCPMSNVNSAPEHNVGKKVGSVFFYDIREPRNTTITLNVPFEKYPSLQSLVNGGTGGSGAMGIGGGGGGAIGYAGAVMAEKMDKELMGVIQSNQKYKNIKEADEKDYDPFDDDELKDVRI